MASTAADAKTPSSILEEDDDHSFGSAILSGTPLGPKSMVEALDWKDPHEALLGLSIASSQRAQHLSKDLATQLAGFVVELPDILKNIDDEEHPVLTSVACADSILHSLSKIASGGSQASQEIRQLEEEKRTLEQQAQDVETALKLRQISDLGAGALSSKKYLMAAQSVQQYIELQTKERLTDRARAYAGEYTIQQMETTQRFLRTKLLELYESAVQQSSLQRLGELTPLLQMVEREKEGVSLYLRYLQSNMTEQLNKQDRTQNPEDEPPYIKMARVYNSAVAALRHHLPMVSQCLYKADGDAAVVQLVHVQVEQSVIPLFQRYAADRQLPKVARSAQTIYSRLEERYRNTAAALSLGDESSRGGEDVDDSGFSVEVGSLSDVDAAMEEAALCLQHAESYMRFLQHTVKEVNKARELRHKAAQEDRRMERERQEWATGMADPQKEEEETPYATVDILPARTQLHEVVAEVGGYYSGIERCLLLASMQRAFATPKTDRHYYSPLGIKGHSSEAASHALQTCIVEACLYAARRGAQRAFATGHTGTASALTNFCADCLGGVLIEVMSRRAEESGVAMLKPGEGLLLGSAGIFNASNLIRQGTHVSSAVVGGGPNKGDEAARRDKMQKDIAKACATFNDMEIAMHHTLQLETILSEAIARGFPPSAQEQLYMCVKSLANVSESFKIASNGALDSLVSVLKPRIRAIVGEAVGSEGSASASFMTSSVMGGGKSSDRSAVRMHYNLDDEAYQLLQLSEGYIARLCSLIDDLIHPLRLHLAPRLSDALVLEVLGTTAKRLEVSLRRCQFTALGALCLDSDMRDLLNYAKQRLDSPELNSNLALYRACVPLARLIQISKLLNVDDLDDVLDLISASKRKGNWDLKLEDAKAFLGLRVEFEGSKVNELLRIDDD